MSVIGARIIRFLAIPYAMATRIDWPNCPRNVLVVLFDHLYIFFRLGYYPDNYGQCRLWEKKRSEWKYYWGSGYDPYVVSLLHRKVQRRDCDVLFEDKEVCYELCRSYGLPLPRQYVTLNPGNGAASAIRGIFGDGHPHQLLLKPIGGSGGKGISLAERKDGEMIVRRIQDPARCIPLDEFVLESRCVVQEKVVQHPDLDAVSSNSLNTIRIATLMSPQNEVILIGAYLRFGSGQAFVDNICVGGYSVGIDLETGRSGSTVENLRGQTYPLSSVTQKAVTSLVIPYWGELVDLARKVQTHFAPFNRLLGMDIGLSPSGPILIEINSGYDNTGIESNCGPILKNEAIRRAFLEYGIISHRLFQVP